MFEILDLGHTVYSNLLGGPSSLSREKSKCEKGSSAGKIQFKSRVEKEYLKPAYSASIGDKLEDGLFDGND